MQPYLRTRIYGGIATTVIVIAAIAATAYFHRIFNNVESSRKIFVPGLEYEYRSQRYPYPLTMHLLKVDPSQIFIGLALGNEKIIGTEKLSCITRRHNGLAGINAGFFMSAACTDGKDKQDARYDGVPVGALKIDGTWCKEPKPNQINLGWTYQPKQPLMGTFKAQWELAIGNKIYPIDSLNDCQNDTSNILYTSAFGDTTLTSSPCTEASLVRGKIKSINHYSTNTAIPSHGYVYSLSQQSASDNSMIQAQQQTKLIQKINPISSITQEKSNLNDWAAMDFIVGGCGTLVKHGVRCENREIIEECQDESFVTSMTARTAVGILPNGDWLFVIVDGTIPKMSCGINLPDLAKFMEKKGCISALNLSGGSSTTLFIDGILKNIPTVPKKYGLEIEAGEQPISSAFILKPRSRKQLGDILIDLKHITPQQLADAAKENSQPAGQTLLERGIIKENQLEDALEMKKRLRRYV